MPFPAGQHSAPPGLPLPAGRSSSVEKLHQGGCTSAKPMLKAAKDAGIAQQVEHLICNQGVTGSNPVAGTIFFNDLRQDRPERSRNICDLCEQKKSHARHGLSEPFMQKARRCCGAGLFHMTSQDQSSSGQPEGVYRAPSTQTRLTHHLKAMRQEYGRSGVITYDAQIR